MSINTKESMNKMIKSNLRRIKNEIQVRQFFASLILLGYPPTKQNMISLKNLSPMTGVLVTGTLLVTQHH